MYGFRIKSLRFIQSHVQNINNLQYVMCMCVLQAELKQIRWPVFGWGGYQGLSVELEQPESHSHSPAPGLPVPQQKCWGPSPREGTSVCLLPSKRPTGEVQRGYLLRSGEASFYMFILTICPSCSYQHLQLCSVCRVQRCLFHYFCRCLCTDGVS